MAQIATRGYGRFRLERFGSLRRQFLCIYRVYICFSALAGVLIALVAIKMVAMRVRGLAFLSHAWRAGLQRQESIGF